MGNRIGKSMHYYSKLIKNLCWCITLNCLLYFIFSSRFSSLNIGEISGVFENIKEVVGFNYSVELFSLINFLLISFTVVKILFSVKKMPIVLIGLLLFTLSLNYNVASLLLGDKMFYVSNFIEKFYSNEFIIKNFIENKYALENINYSMNFVLILYSFVRTVLSDIKNINYNPSYSNGRSFYNTRVDNYYDDYNNDFYEEKKFNIRNNFDKEEVYNKRYTNGNDRVIDENGIEKYVWEYANDYENEKRLEEDRRLQEEQNFYHNYYYNNNDSYNYNPYSNDNSYGSSSWDNNDSYYNGDDSHYNNDNYYDNNDDWF